MKSRPSKLNPIISKQRLKSQIGSSRAHPCPYHGGRDSEATINTNLQNGTISRRKMSSKVPLDWQDEPVSSKERPKLQLKYPKGTIKGSVYQNKTLSNFYRRGPKMHNGQYAAQSPPPLKHISPIRRQTKIAPAPPQPQYLAVNAPISPVKRDQLQSIEETTPGGHTLARVTQAQRQKEKTPLHKFLRDSTNFS